MRCGTARVYAQLVVLVDSTRICRVLVHLVHEHDVLTAVALEELHFFESGALFASRAARAGPPACVCKCCQILLAF